MIFKTFNSDIDKMSAKWGVFGKSFYDFFDIANKRKIKIDDLITYHGMSLEEAKNEVGSLWSNLFPSKKDLQIDIDTLIPEFDTDSARLTLEELQNIQTEINHTKGSWDDYHDKFKDGKEYLLDYAKTNNVLESSVDDVKQANQAARASAIAHNAALNQMTLGAKAASVAMKAFGNMIAFWAISKGISLVAEGITWAYKQISGKAAEEAKQKIHELGETARSEFQSIQDSLKSTVSRVNEVKDRYAELAQGVENLGKSNQSRGKLSTEDYEEFLSISNELSSLMPDLTKTYDDNGNAILNLNGDIQTITNSLNDFIEAQKRMAAQDMFTKMPDIYSDYRQTVSEYADKYNNSQDKANIY